jgi:hypothetical protein
LADLLLTFRLRKIFGKTLATFWQNFGMTLNLFKNTVSIIVLVTAGDRSGENFGSRRRHGVVSDGPGLADLRAPSG